MTDYEKMRKAFAPLHASPDTLTEVMKMTKTGNNRNVLKRIGTLALAAVLVLALGSVAYASDLGGIQRTVQVWLHGELTDATFTFAEGSYNAQYTDENGDVKYMGGGGVAFDTVTGEERPLTEEELLAAFDTPEVSYPEDGTVVVSYRGQTLDITDRFDADGVCYVELQDGDRTLYLTVKYQDGYAMSETKYCSPDEFSTASSGGTK